jgi:hypothetical protein
VAGTKLSVRRLPRQRKPALAVPAPLVTAGNAARVVKSLWIGGSLPRIQRLSIRSFLDQGHDYHLYAYEEISDVPRGTTVRDATVLLPRESIFCYQTDFGKGSFSAFSNLFRYQLLLEQGGWWVDTDVVCLKPFDFDAPFVFASEEQQDRSVVASSCVIKSPAGAEFLDYCVKISESKNKAELKWSEIGPRLLGEAVERFALHGHRVGHRVFNPVNWFDFAEVLAPGFEPSRLAGSHAVHLWNQMWRHHGVDPEAAPAPGSMYAYLLDRYPGSSGLRD